MRTCRRCDTAKPDSEFYGRKTECKDCARVRIRDIARRKRAGDPEAVARYQAEWRAAHPEAVAAIKRTNRESVRDKVLDHYGRACACCGSTGRLQIDHINGDGAAHRAEVSTDGYTIYRWIIKHGYPEGFQTLCLPCNNSKGRGERCRLDHQRGE